MSVAVSFRLPARTIALSAAAVGAGAAIIGLCAVLLGGSVAWAAYLGVLFLIGPARKLPFGQQALAAGWATLVAGAGTLLAGAGTWPTLLALVLVCLGQGAFALGEIATLTRSPASLIIFSGFGGPEGAAAMELWSAVGGVCIGAAVVLVLSRFASVGAPLPPQRSLWERLRYGAVLALGCVITVAVAEVLALPKLHWALLALCLVLGTQPGGSGARAAQRVLGTVAGVVLAVLAAQLLSPPLIAGLVLACAILCVAYLSRGELTLYLACVTPAILLLGSFGSAQSSIAAGADRILATLLGVGIALLMEPVLRWWLRATPSVGTARGAGA